MHKNVWNLLGIFRVQASCLPVLRSKNIIISQNMNVVIGVLSGKNEEQRRKGCRETWMQDFCNANVNAMFLVGDPKSAEAYCDGNDILYLPCPDTYQCLPQKTRLFCKHALESWDFDYLFKCDDDTYVHVDRFLNFDPEGADYLGIDPVGTNEFNSGGAGYFLSRKAAIIVAEQLIDTVGPEDLLVGKLMARNGIKRSQSHKFQAWKLDRTIPTPKNDGITVHYIRGQEMYDIHNQFVPKIDL
jgi:hypothetical protein